MSRNHQLIFCPVINSKCKTDCGLWQPDSKQDKTMGECLGIKALLMLTTRVYYYDNSAFSDEDMKRFGSMAPGSMVELKDVNDTKSIVEESQDANQDANQGKNSEEEQPKVRKGKHTKGHKD